MTGPDGKRLILPGGPYDSDTAALAAIQRYHGTHALGLHIDADRHATPLASVYAELVAGLGGKPGTVHDRARFQARVMTGTAKAAHPDDVLGRVPVGSVSRSTVAAWCTGLLRRGQAPSTVRKWLGMVAQTLDFAVDERYIRENPVGSPRVRRAMVPAVPRKPHYLFTLDELVLMTWAAQPAYALMHETLLWTGMRQQEVRALVPRSLLRSRRRIRIESAIGTAGSLSVHDTPKTIGSGRIIPCPAPIFDALVERAEGMAPTAPLFPAPDGGWLHGGWYAHDIAAMRERAGLLGDPADENPGRRRPPTAHDARSTVASFLSAAGVPAAAAQSHLGHSSSAMTLDVYTEVSDHLNADPAIRAARLDGLDVHEVLDLLYATAWTERAPALLSAFDQPSDHEPNRGGRPARDRN